MATASTGRTLRDPIPSFGRSAEPAFHVPLADPADHEAKLTFVSSPQESDAGSATDSEAESFDWNAEVDDQGEAVVSATKDQDPNGVDSTKRPTARRGRRVYLAFMKLTRVSRV